MPAECEVVYYPGWSSRGIRGARCHHPAKYTVVDPPKWSGKHVCGVHARMARANLDPHRVLDGIYREDEG